MYVNIDGTASRMRDTATKPGRVGRKANAGSVKSKRINGEAHKKRKSRRGKR